MTLACLGKLNKPIILDGDINMHINVDDWLVHLNISVSDARSFLYECSANMRAVTVLTSSQWLPCSWDYTVELLYPIFAEHNDVVVNFHLVRDLQNISWHSNHSLIIRIVRIHLLYFFAIAISYSLERIIGQIWSSHIFK